MLNQQKNFIIATKHAFSAGLHGLVHMGTVIFVTSFCRGQFVGSLIFVNVSYLQSKDIWLHVGYTCNHTQ